MRCSLQRGTFKGVFRSFCCGLLYIRLLDMRCDNMIVVTCCVLLTWWDFEDLCKANANLTGWVNNNKNKRNNFSLRVVFLFPHYTLEFYRSRHICSSYRLHAAKIDTNDSSNTRTFQHYMKPLCYVCYELTARYIFFFLIAKLFQRY